ncbi:MAG: DUF6456 domain-containing protein [Rhodospirillales bacterium]
MARTTPGQTTTNAKPPNRRRRKAAATAVLHRPGDLLESVYEADPDGRPVVHHRVVDTLGRMRKAGTINDGMHDAARDFQASFTIASYAPPVCLPLDGVPGTGSRAELTDAQLDARRRVMRALDALGGIGSPAGGCVWHVVGLQRSIREWAMRQGWGGRSIGEKQAQGILVAALGVLAAFYGYAGAPRSKTSTRAQPIACRR